jgi:proline dehydrogenase
MANSKSVILNPDKNRLVGGLMRIMFYNHFCAGSSDLEVRKTVSTMKEMGFKGVILGYAKEVIVDPAATREEVAGSGSATSIESAIDQWRDGNLRSLPMIGKGDFLAIKYVLLLLCLLLKTGRSINMKQEQR